MLLSRLYRERAKDLLKGVGTVITRRSQRSFGENSHPKNWIIPHSSQCQDGCVDEFGNYPSFQLQMSD